MHLLSVPSRDPPLCVFLKKDQGPASLKSASPNTIMFWGTAEEGFNYEFGWEGTHFRPEHITVFLKIILHSYHFFPQVFKQWELSLFCHCYSVAKYVDSLQPHGLQHGRLLCPPLLPRVCSNLCHLVELVNLSNHLILCCPLLLLLSIFASIRVFSNELALRIRWPKYWIFSFNISPSNEYSGLVSFRIDWLKLLAVQGTLKSLPQHRSSRTSILWCSVFLMVHIHTWPLEKPQLWLYAPLSAKWYPCFLIHCLVFSC